MDQINGDTRITEKLLKAFDKVGEKIKAYLDLPENVQVIAYSDWDSVACPCCEAEYVDVVMEICYKDVSSSCNTIIKVYPKPGGYMYKLTIPKKDDRLESFPIGCNLEQIRLFFNKYKELIDEYEPIAKRFKGDIYACYKALVESESL